MGGKMKRKNSMWIVTLGLTAAIATGCAGGQLTTREKGAGIGALGGAAAGGLIGTAFDSYSTAPPFSCHCLITAPEADTPTSLNPFSTKNGTAS